MYTAIFHRLYQMCIQPNGRDEDRRRQEFIFVGLVLSSLALTLVGLGSMIVHKLVLGPDYRGASPWLLVVPALILLGLYLLSRRRFVRPVVYVFIGIYWALGTFALFAYGFAMPEGLMTYALVLIMSGVLLSARAAVVATTVIMASLGVLSYLQLHGYSRPDLKHMDDPLHASSVIIFCVLFAIILLVCWLSTREIEKSLRRARASELALRQERNSLEIKVRQRTRELEQVQMEKMLELQRFAEFGRFSSSLVHDLANPLTSAAIELEQLASRGRSRTLKEARKSIAIMESYVDSARRQLKHESTITIFDAAQEVKRVQGFLESLAHSKGVKLAAEVLPARINGDAVRFDQILANLLVNAIEAYDECDSHTSKAVLVVMRIVGQRVELSVRDYGRGIPQEALPHIFKPFFSTKSRQRGTGIGLSIAKQSVEQVFGGTIRASSSQRLGTRFMIRIPLV